VVFPENLRASRGDPGSGAGRNDRDSRSGTADRPLIPEGMPVLVDDDLRFEDSPTVPRPTVVVNRWLRELPASGAPAASSWETYARAVKDWAEFLSEYGVGLFESRERLKSGLSQYAEHRAAGPVKARFAATTWGQHMSILSLFYRWAMAEGYASAEPFTTAPRGRCSPGPGVAQASTFAAFGGRGSRSWRGEVGGRGRERWTVSYGYGPGVGRVRARSWVHRW
jgi:integrase family protein with SAM-like domain